MRIGIVNDLTLACEALRRAVLSTGRHQVAWIAIDGAQAIELAVRDRPDLILMDMIMPGIDGVEATRRIMRESPCPILVVTATISGNIAQVFNALGHGALDVVETPTFDSRGELTGGAALLQKIQRIEHLPDRPPIADRERPAAPTAAVPLVAPRARLVVCGASTGGPKVLAEILAALPRDLPAAVVIAQHVDEAYAAGFAQWLGGQTKLPVALVTSSVEPRAGQVYVGSSREHLVVRADLRLHCTDEPRGHWYRPSVDVLFHSVARYWPQPGVGVLLTGMGRDGAEGLAQLRRAGWNTIAQDQATSIVWGMPKAAVALGAAEFVLPAAEIPTTIIGCLHRVSSRKPASNR